MISRLQYIHLVQCHAQKKWVCLDCRHLVTWFDWVCLHIGLLDLDGSFGCGVVDVVMALRDFGNGTSLIPLLLFITYGWIDCAHCWMSL